MEQKKMTLKTRVMNFVESFGPDAEFSWSDLHEFVVLEKACEGKFNINEYFDNPRRFRGYFESPFLQGGWGYWGDGKIGYMMKPSKKEPRYLVKKPNGKYVLAA